MRGTMARAQRSKKHLVWIDCEMTGLDPAKNVLLEIATIITNYDLDIVARGPVLAIRQSEARLELMDAWNRRTHRESGLLDRVRNEGVSVAMAERETLKFVKRHCYARTTVPCGRSNGASRTSASRAVHARAARVPALQGRRRQLDQGAGQRVVRRAL